MPFTSPGAVRSAGRKAANSLRSNHPNGGTTHSGGGGTGSRALHTATNQLSHHSGGAHKLTTTLDAIRPRNPAHVLFSSTKGFVTNLFNRLAAPGIRVPGLDGSFAGRSLQQARPITIQAGLSLPVRHAIRNNNFRVAWIGFIPPPCTKRTTPVRNFSSARPIFQNLVDNVPIAVRALYEADLDDLKNGRNKRFGARKIPTRVKKTKTSVKGSKLKAKSTIVVPMKKIEEEKAFDSAEFERYFPTPALPAVTTELLIPLAPAPASRVPLSALDAMEDEALAGSGRFLPLPRIGQMHQSHTNHALKVSTLFARLDQANVWARGGVVCSAYSGPGSGAIRERRLGATEDGIKLEPGNINLAELEGTCTMLKVEFQGWTAGEVRGVIGESGKGWCNLEEVWHDEEDNASMFADSLSGVSTPAFFSPPHSRPPELTFDMGMPQMDPAQSFILPTLDFSASLPSDTNERKAFAAGGTPPQKTTALSFEDPWAEFETSSTGSLDLEDGYMSYSSPLSRTAETLEAEESNGRGLRAIPFVGRSWRKFQNRFSKDDVGDPDPAAAQARIPQLPAELLAEIACNNLPAKDLLSMCLTCSQWHVALLPQLYTTVTLRTFSQFVRPYNYAWPRMEDQRGEAAAFKAMEACRDVLIDLSKDLIGLHSFAWEGIQLPCDRLWDALRAKHLRNIGSRGAISDSLYSFTNLTHFSLVVPELVGVDHNWLLVQAELPAAFWAMIQGECPDLEQLAITSRSPYILAHNFSPVVQGHWPQLKSLTLGPFGLYMGGTLGPALHHDVEFVQFLARHPRLEELNLVWELRLIDAGCSSNPEDVHWIWQQLQALPNLAKLETLKLTCEPLIESQFEDVAHVIERLPNLLSLSIDFDSIGHQHETSNSMLLFKTLAASCPRLEELDLICKGHENEGPIKPLLMELGYLQGLRKVSLTKGFRSGGKLMDTTLWLVKVLPSLEEGTLRWAKKKYPCGIKQVGIYKVLLDPETQQRTLDVAEMVRCLKSLVW
ncbi:hypothetical protein BKA70DRAFT_1214847 [Coprinopsis sp. MPI-PUGE-AT-0042]|nr:hypothetical protein BKA70DRAFT_1214847 [Coprinopsis sp. MPI-PUGE-AT-0042]